MYQGKKNGFLKLQFSNHTGLNLWHCGTLPQCFVFRCPLYGYFSTFQTSLIKLIDQAFNEVVHIWTYIVMCEMPEDVQNIFCKIASNTPIFRGTVPCCSSSWKQSKSLQGMAGDSGHLCTANLTGSCISIGYELAKSLDMWLTGRRWEEAHTCTCLQWEHKPYCRL